jgi:hypothetical protein
MVYFLKVIHLVVFSGAKIGRKKPLRKGLFLKRRGIFPKREEDSPMPPDDDREGEAWLSGFASAPHKEILFFDEMFA